MHPTAAALCLAGYRLWQFKKGRGEYLCFVASWHTDSYGYLNQFYAVQKLPPSSACWTLRWNWPAIQTPSSGYKEIDWSSIPDSVWDQCKLSDAVEVLEDRLPF